MGSSAAPFITPIGHQSDKVKNNHFKTLRSCLAASINCLVVFIINRKIIADEVADTRTIAIFSAVKRTVSKTKHSQ